MDAGDLYVRGVPRRLRSLEDADGVKDAKDTSSFLARGEALLAAQVLFMLRADVPMFLVMKSEMQRKVSFILAI